jgi:hypothetical protein
MTRMSMMNMLIALVLAYVITSATSGNTMLSLYQIFSSQVLVLKLSVIFMALGAVVITIEQLVANNKRYRAARTLRRTPGLRQHMIDGVCGGSFAYLAKQVQYGTEGAWLPPMSEVFVICDLEEIEPDPTRERTMLVVPYFKEVDLTRPSIAVKVPKQDLFKHIPRHMIPEII